MDWAEQGEGLVKKNKTYLPKREPALPAKEPIDLPTARTVLQTVVDTNEDSLTVSSDLSKVGPYSTQQVRAAFHILTEDILENHPRTGNSLEFRTVKETPHGMVVLVANRKLEYTKGGSIKVIAPIGKIKSISLDLRKSVNVNPMLFARILLTEGSGDTPESTKFGFDSQRFDDNRLGGKSVWMHDLRKGKELQIDKYRHLYKGMRWIAANILNWDGEFKLPEDLGKPSLLSGRELPDPDK